MKIFIDSSVFLKLLLNEPGSDIAQAILEDVEYGKVIGYVTPMVLEEVCFKLIYAKASELLGTKNVWKIRESLRLSSEFRSKTLEVVRKFYEYIEYLFLKGLRVEPVMYSDWQKAYEIMRKYGLLPADAVHVAVALRVKANTLASFDEDFRVIREVRIIP